MRKAGILNAQLAHAINCLGHTDTFAVADCGLPIPADVETIDLALVFGVPRFSDVISAILSEVIVESATIADTTPAEVLECLNGLELSETTHAELKKQISGVKFVIRTGETTPFANVIFSCGVPF